MIKRYRMMPFISSFFFMLGSIKYAFSRNSANDFDKIKKIIELNNKTVSVVEIEEILEREIEYLSDDEKDILIQSLLDYSRGPFLLHSNDLIHDKDYIDAKGSFSFKG